MRPLRITNHRFFSQSWRHMTASISTRSTISFLWAGAVGSCTFLPFSTPPPRRPCFFFFFFRPRCSTLLCVEENRSYLFILNSNIPEFRPIVVAKREEKRLASKYACDFLSNALFCLSSFYLRVCFLRHETRPLHLKISRSDFSPICVNILIERRMATAVWTVRILCVPTCV